MKRFLTLMLAAVICLSFAACGNTDAEKADGKHFAIATDKGFSPFEFQDAEGNIVDSGCGIATDEEVAEMLDELFPDA